MHLDDLIEPDDLARATADGLVKERAHPDLPLRILNYTDAALWTAGAWDNPAVRVCRGLIVDDDDRVIARPWSKFFNHGQPEAGQLDLDSTVEVTDKLDGSLGIIYPTPDGPAVATRGSFTSDQAVHATQWLRARTHMLGRPDQLAQWTVLVEIIYPANRIVCDYGDLDELVLIGGVHIDTGRTVSPEALADHIGWAGRKTHVFSYLTLREALAAKPRPGAEGLVVRYLNAETQRIVKVKQDDYVQLHRVVTGLSERTVWQAMVDGRDITSVLDGLPDELHPWVRDVWGRLDIKRLQVLIAARSAHIAVVTGLGLGEPFTRAEYAREALKHGQLSKWMFFILDGKDPSPAILKTLKPAGDTRARGRSEDVA